MEYCIYLDLMIQVIWRKEKCGICHKEFEVTWWSEPPGVSKASGIYYKNFTAMEMAENWDNIERDEYKKLRWLSVCQNCYKNKEMLPDGIVDEIDLEKHKSKMKTYDGELLKPNWSFTTNFDEVPVKAGPRPSRSACNQGRTRPSMSRPAHEGGRPPRRVG